MARKLCSAAAYLIVIQSLVSSCQHRQGREALRRESNVNSNTDAALNSWFAFSEERIHEGGVNSLSIRGGFSRDKAAMIAGFGIQNPQSVDLGVYGKIGTTPVFVARRNQIGDFDRLYWAMVKVLSEKYGCFIVHKASSARLVRFTCRDRRTVVFERALDAKFAKFSGRQFDRQGREIIIKPKALAYVKGDEARP